MSSTFENEAFRKEMHEVFNPCKEEIEELLNELFGDAK